MHQHQLPIAPDHGTKYEENSSGHHGRLHEDGWTDRETYRWADWHVNGWGLILFLCSVWHAWVLRRRSGEGKNKDSHEQSLFHDGFSVILSQSLTQHVLHFGMSKLLDLDCLGVGIIPQNCWPIAGDLLISTDQWDWLILHTWAFWLGPWLKKLILLERHS